METKKDKCQYIEMCRFIGSIMILCHHSYTLMERTFFIGGWAFVEFYFILTGYYTTLHFSKRMEKCKVECDEIFFYVKNKIKKLYPYAVGGGCLASSTLLHNVLKMTKALLLFH